MNIKLPAISFPSPIKGKKTKAVDEIINPAIETDTTTAQKKNKQSTKYVITEERSNAHKTIARLLGFVCLLFVLGLSFQSWRFGQMLDAKSTEVFVIKESSEKVYQAEKRTVDTEDQFRSDYEYRGHLKSFMNNMFAYDQYTYDEQIDLGLNQIDSQGGLVLVSSLQENRTKQQLIQSNGYTRIIMDSMKIQAKEDGASASVWFAQRTIIGDKKADNAYLMNCKMQPVKRTDKNPFGILIKEAAYFPYKGYEAK